MTILLLASVPACQSTQPNPVPASTPTPIPIPIDPSQVSVEIHQQLMGPGFYRLTGVIHNGADGSVAQPNLRIWGENAAGQEVFAKEVSPIPSGIPARQDTPFVALIPAGEMEAVERVRAELQQIEPAPVPIVTIPIQNQQIVQDDAGHSHLLGEISNPSSHMLEVTSAAGVVRDADGKVVELQYAFTGSRTLEPGQKFPVRVSFLTALQPGERPEWIVHAYPPEDYSLLTHENTQVESFLLTVDQNGAYHLSGEVTNSISKPFYAQVTGAVYSSAGELLDVSEGTLPFFVFLPGQAVPLELSDFPLISNSIQRQQSAGDIVRLWLHPAYALIQARPLGLEDIKLHPELDSVRISGSILNTLDVEINAAALAVGLRTPDGKLAAAEYQTYPVEAAPGAEIPFELRIQVPPGLNLDDLEAICFAEGVLP